MIFDNSIGESIARKTLHGFPKFYNERPRRLIGTDGGLSGESASCVMNFVGGFERLIFRRSQYVNRSIFHNSLTMLFGTFLTIEISTNPHAVKDLNLNMNEIRRTCA